MALLHWWCRTRSVRPWIVALALATSGAAGCVKERGGGEGVPPNPDRGAAAATDGAPDAAGTPTAAVEPSDRSSRDAGCEPATVYGPPTCTTDADCVAAMGPGWFCDAEVQTYDDGCGGRIEWGRLCAPGPAPEPSDGGAEPAPDATDGGRELVTDAVEVSRESGGSEASEVRERDRDEIRMVYGPARANAPLDRESIRAAIRGQSGALARCAQAAWDADGTLGDFRVKVRVLWRPDGGCTVEPLLEAPAAFEASGGRACVQVAMQAALASLEPPEDGVVIVMPFNFVKPAAP